MRSSLLKWILSRFKRENEIRIDGESYRVRGNNITINNDSIWVDGVLVKSGLKSTVKVEFIGDLGNLKCTQADIQGNITGDVDATSVTCHNITGDVDATSVTCHNITGDVDATSVTYNGRR